MCHCETTRFLASLLDGETDRMAIIQTSTPGQSASEPGIVAPLSNIKMRKLKATLDQITTSSARSSIARIADSLYIAQELLLGHDVDVKYSDRSPRPTYGHVFLFTAYIDDSLEEFALNERLTLHLVCASVLPQQSEHWPRTNGWRIRSMTGKEPRSESRKTDGDLDDLEQDLMNLVHHARSGQTLGMLNSVGVELTAGSDSTIEEILGSRYFEYLQPGEVRSIIIKIKCKGTKATKNSVSVSAAVPNDDDLFGELETMLNGWAATPILHAQVRYSHPWLPKDVICSVARTCNVRHVINMPGNLDMMRKPTSVLESAERLIVHRHLAFCCFTQLSPLAAMSALERVIATGDGRMACPEYVALLMKEQQYQKRIAESMLSSNTSQLEIENQRFKNGATLVHKEFSNNLGNAKDPSSAELLSTENFPDIGEGKFSATRDTSDDTRKRLLALGGKAPNSTSEYNDRLAKGLKHTVLRNKRSVGTDTLRSLALSAKTSPGFVAPW